MRSVRTITYALVVLPGFYLASMLEVRAVEFLLGHVRFGAFVPLSLSTAAGITRDKTVLLVTLASILLAVLPCSTTALSHALLPVGIGIVLGTLIGQGIREAKEKVDGEPVHRDDQP